jgi:hypothetical protein
MTLSTTQPAIVYLGDGSTTAFTFAFPMSDIGQAVVTITDTTQTPNVVTTLTAGTQYAISAMPCPNGGTVTYPYPSGIPLAPGFRLTIRRVVPYGQTTSIINQGGFYPEILEGALDYLTMQTQQLAEQTSRSLQVPVGSGIDPAAYLNGLQTNMATLSASASASAGNAATSAAAAQNYLSSLSGTSSTALGIATGPQTLTVGVGLNLTLGQFIILAATASPANFMHGQVTSYNAATGALTINAQDVGGSGAFNAWTLSLAGPQGPQGATGPSGSVLAVTAGAGLSGGTITTTGTIGIAANGVANGMLATSPAYTVKGNATASAASPQDLSASALGAMITPALTTFTSGMQGAVPASGGGTANFLRADGRWMPTMNIPVRQAVLAADTNANNQAAFLTAGSGLTPAYTVGSGPLVMTFANGSGAAGEIDLVTILSAAGSLSAVPANCASYLYAVYASATSVTWGSVLVPPQYGQTFDCTGYSLLHFDGAAGSTAMLDDWGTAWTAVGGAKLQSNQFKFGATSLGGGGTNNALIANTDYIKTTNTFPLPPQWTIRFWVYPTSLSAQNTLIAYSTAVNAAGFAIEVTSGIVGTSIVAGTGMPNGTHAIATGTWSLIELGYDGTTYRQWVNGVLDTTLTSSVLPNGGTLGYWFVGSGYVPGQAQYGLNGYIDEIEVLPYCLHPNNTGYVAPTAASNIQTAGYAADWFNTATMTWCTLSASTSAGVGPGYTPSGVNKVYVGECVAGTSAITSVTSYALRAQHLAPWVAGLPGTSTVFSVSDNLGTHLKEVKVEVKCLGAELGYSVGDIVEPYTQGSSLTIPFTPRKLRNTTSATTGNTTSWLVGNATTGIPSSTVAANWAYRIRVKRSF